MSAAVFPVAPRTAELRRRIVAALRQDPASPATTREICDRAGFTRLEHHAEVAPQLRALARRGVVEQVSRPPGGMATWKIARP